MNGALAVWIARTVFAALFSILTAALGRSVKRIRHRRAEKTAQQEAMREGMLALMHDRIYCIYRECQRKGYLTVEELSNLEFLYKPYAALGGNGTGRELYERMKSMPTEPSKNTAH